MAAQEQDWLSKCIQCQHCYIRKADDDVYYCRKRNGECEYKPQKIKKGDKNGKVFNL